MHKAHDQGTGQERRASILVSIFVMVTAGRCRYTEIPATVIAFLSPSHAESIADFSNKSMNGKIFCTLAFAGSTKPHPAHLYHFLLFFVNASHSANHLASSPDHFSSQTSHVSKSPEHVKPETRRPSEVNTQAQTMRGLLDWIYLHFFESFFRSCSPFARMRALARTLYCRDCEPFFPPTIIPFTHTCPCPCDSHALHALSFAEPEKVYLVWRCGRLLAYDVTYVTCGYCIKGACSLCWLLLRRVGA